MQNRRIFLHRAVFVCLILALFQACSARQIVLVGPPYDRHDHNRSRAIIISSSAEGHTNTVRVLTDEVYTPFGSVLFPSVNYKEENAHTDGLPSANVVPIFTGIRLPLSDEYIEGGQSDRDDIIDFLATGAHAHAGVEHGSMAGDMKSTQALYKPVLDFFSSKENLLGVREVVLGRLAFTGITFADEIIDSRYSPSSFDDVLAFRFEKFWFILYKLPDRKEYSRLVVVPAEMKAQDFHGKRL